MTLGAKQRAVLLGLCLFWGWAIRVEAGITESPPPELPPIDPGRVAVPAVELRPDFQKYFEALHVKGSFVLFDREGNRFVRTNPERCGERFPPASTFKILNALMALDAGIVEDENTVIPWNGTQYQIASWNHDQSLKSAMADSVVWYYQELARRLGKERIQRYVDAVGYGNRNLSGAVDSFWLDGGLRISQEEQIDFLRKLYQGELPFSARSMEIVKRIIVLEESPNYRLSGKTATVQQTGQPIGWFVGYLEKGGRVYFFATNVEGSTVDQSFLRSRVQVTREIFRELGLVDLP